VETNEVATIAELKAFVESKEGIPAEAQRLIYGGRQWDDEESLFSAEDLATFHLTASLDGGRKKRKKKTYTKPKKTKRKHKKVKLAVLRYYRVEQGSGKVTRLRKECPHPQCGPGIFMGEHFNRHYCGKCGLTYMITNPKPQPKKEAAAPAAAAAAPAAAAKGGKGKKK